MNSRFERWSIYMRKTFSDPVLRNKFLRAKMAERKVSAETQKQEELRIQCKKEQEVFNDRVLVSEECKDKLSVGFIHEQPQGLQNHIKEEGELEFKFERQRRYPASESREQIGEETELLKDLTCKQKTKLLKIVKIQAVQVDIEMKKSIYLHKDLKTVLSEIE
ncbi:hypothetical protein QYM36_015734 [Artemia franciscana]|uniref:Uncharacterized protein n=1 Tax=Artemia franciscana TaxID=6661 RepID=A0AA88KX78_ARTSF|nr:hypothetical protein QYM36_015734 [Artemia franciscana]